MVITSLIFNLYTEFWWFLAVFKMANLLCCVSPPTGQFKNYKPYQVSLFEVLHNGKVHYLLSAIGYSLQRSKYLCIVLGPLIQLFFFFSHLSSF